MGLAAQTFSGISPERFTALSEKVREQTGVGISGPSGQASAKGFTLRWDYSEQDQQLVIECTHKPMLVPASMVMSKIRELVEQS